VFDRNGAVLFSRNLTLQAFAQHHEFLNQFIGELNVGYFRVRIKAGQSQLCLKSEGVETTYTCCPTYEGGIYEMDDNEKFQGIVNGYEWKEVENCS
jgi:hypothetical protein